MIEKSVSIQPITDIPKFALPIYRYTNISLQSSPVPVKPKIRFPLGRALEHEDGREIGGAAVLEGEVEIPRGDLALLVAQPEAGDEPVFPHIVQTEDLRKLEAERRRACGAITRARQRHLSCLTVNLKRIMNPFAQWVFSAAHVPTVPTR